MPFELTDNMNHHADQSGQKKKLLPMARTSLVQKINSLITTSNDFVREDALKIDLSAVHRKQFDPSVRNEKLHSETSYTFNKMSNLAGAVVDPTNQQPNSASAVELNLKKDTSPSKGSIKRQNRQGTSGNQVVSKQSEIMGQPTNPIVRCNSGQKFQSPMKADKDNYYNEGNTLESQYKLGGHSSPFFKNYLKLGDQQKLVPNYKIVYGSQKNVRNTKITSPQKQSFDQSNQKKNESQNAQSKLIKNIFSSNKNFQKFKSTNRYDKEGEDELHQLVKQEHNVSQSQSLTRKSNLKCQNNIVRQLQTSETKPMKKPNFHTTTHVMIQDFCRNSSQNQPKVGKFEANKIDSIEEKKEGGFEDSMNESPKKWRDRRPMSEDSISEVILSPESIPGERSLALEDVMELSPVPLHKFESPKKTKRLSSHRFKCSCAPSSEPDACASAYRWLRMANKGRHFEMQKGRKSYLDILGIKDFISTVEQRQIECDITRTFPYSKTFQEREGEGCQNLQRVLQAFSKYDSTIGYVQGMNFIVGALLLHCSEEVAFWLFVALIEDYEMRDIYMEGLPGLMKHSTLISQLMEMHLPDLYQHLQEVGMSIEIFATDWYFTLFAKLIPTSQMNSFFDNFFEFGWCFFHKFTLTLLRILSPQILEIEDMQEIKYLLSLPRHQHSQDSQTGTQLEISMKISNRNSESEEIIPPSVPQQQNQPTFLSSLGTLLGFLNQSEVPATNDKADTQLQKLLGTVTVKKLLQKEDAWLRIIIISKQLWGKILTDAQIKKFLNDYDDLQEKQDQQLSHQPKFEQSDDQDESIDSDLVIVQDSEKINKTQNYSGTMPVQKRLPSDQPEINNKDSFTSNEVSSVDADLDNSLDDPLPRKKVHESGMRPPGQIAYRAINSSVDIIQEKQHSQPATARHIFTEQPLDEKFRCDLVLPKAARRYKVTQIASID